MKDSNNGLLQNTTTYNNTKVCMKKNLLCDLLECVVYDLLDFVNIIVVNSLKSNRKCCIPRTRVKSEIQKRKTSGSQTTFALLLCSRTVGFVHL